jgi:hypothetical protein
MTHEEFWPEDLVLAHFGRGPPAGIRTPLQDQAVALNICPRCHAKTLKPSQWRSPFPGVAVLECGKCLDLHVVAA